MGVKCDTCDTCDVLAESRELVATNIKLENQLAAAREEVATLNRALYNAAHLLSCDNEEQNMIDKLMAEARDKRAGGDGNANK